MMKYVLFLGLFAFLGGNELTDKSVGQPESKKNNITQCVSKDELSFEQAKIYKRNGKCVRRADGRGFACVRKNWFEKGNCLTERVVADEKQ